MNDRLRPGRSGCWCLWDLIVTPVPSFIPPAHTSAKPPTDAGYGPGMIRFPPSSALHPLDGNGLGSTCPFFPSARSLISVTVSGVEGAPSPSGCLHSAHVATEGRGYHVHQVAELIVWCPTQERLVYHLAMKNGSRRGKRGPGKGSWRQGRKRGGDMQVGDRVGESLGTPGYKSCDSRDVSPGSWGLCIYYRIGEHVEPFFLCRLPSPCCLFPQKNCTSLERSISGSYLNFYTI